MEAQLADVRKIFEPLNIDGILVTNGFNMNYLTGFDGGEGDGLVLIGKDNIALITDDRYEVEYREKLADTPVELLVTRNYWGVAMAAAKRFKIERLGFEDSIMFRDFDYIDENFDGVDIVPVPELFESIREVKNDDEISKLRHAAEISVAGFNAILPDLHVGMTERQVANLLDFRLKELGADKPSFDTIVASGARAALPHGLATDKVIEAGEMVTIDFGYYVDGYTSDITRTIAFGEPTAQMREVYDVVLTAQKAGIAALQLGNSAIEVDAAARKIIDDAGYGKNFSHSTGHGIGLDIHEGPVLSKNADKQDLVRDGMVLTVEPGIYLENVGGVRIEDDIVVSVEGNENLTAGIPTDLIVIDQ
ncbi:Xaa-Pro aminopeptidase [Weissella uvarum]|uniref:M24 family metallopeptidase n=1 Tax=Weissella uvarum TaxID=1479233 RepID=UPI0019612F9A|nr:aminopeptidase P family protein [Weissella uvarum]MBM7616526.1 Xaa-Pro aminopeptidase [Weissella uvarum]MCM0595013.1 aminopeptidase P family protein [Weissella uvarum]